MKLDENDLSHLKFLGYQLGKVKNLAIVYNALGFTSKIDKRQEDSDFFLNKEIGEIFDDLFKSGIRVLSYQNEKNFIEDALSGKIEFSNTLVWNLSRQGSDNNQKSLITSFCDFYRIPYIGSSVYSMNLARHKYHFQKILESSKLPYIPTYTISEFKILENKEGRKYLLKRVRGSASRGMSEKSSNLTYYEMIEYLNVNSITNNYTVQQYIEGYEIEVPVFQLNGKFKALGACGIEIGGKKFLNSIMPEESGNSSYTFYNFEKFANQTLNYTNCDYVFDLAESIADKVELKDYGRIDFRVDSYNNYYCFDISSTPYVTEHSSLNFLMKETERTHSDLLLLILGAFSSNIDNR